jgi:hypothetical protein
MNKSQTVRLIIQAAQSLCEKDKKIVSAFIPNHNDDVCEYLFPELDMLLLICRNVLEVDDHDDYFTNMFFNAIFDNADVDEIVEDMMDYALEYHQVK